MSLRPKQQRFVEEYLVDLNATAAAVRAGYKEKTAAQQGHNLLQMAKVQEAIKEEVAQRQERTKITGDQVVTELAQIAFAKVDDYYRDYGLDVRLADKIKALELLGKHFGIFGQTAGAPMRATEDDPLTASLKEWVRESGN